MATIKKQPTRKCVGCNQTKDKKDLIRVIRDNEGNTFLDDTGRKNGRGAYICKCNACLLKAVKNKGLERSLKAPIGEDVYEALRKELSNIE